MSTPDNPPIRLRLPPMPGELRTPERIRAHYLVERELADRLRHSDRERRKALYNEVYQELYARVPDHPQLTSKSDARAREIQVGEQLAILGRFLRRDTVFLEIGAGDCALSLAVAPRVARVVAIEVSEQVASGARREPNFSLVISDGQSVPVPPASVTVAYSNQLMEHLHPDDAEAQLAAIRTALAPGGVYVCITPNRLTGPHDVSMYFDDVATGFHMREYTIRSFAALARRSGFSKTRMLPSLRGHSMVAPLWPFMGLEAVLDALPLRLRHAVAGLPVIRTLLQVRIAVWR